MKKCLLIFFSILTFFISSCNFKEDGAESLKVTADEVIRCFDEDDMSALKLLFSKYTLNEALDIEKQIENAFNCYEGKSKSYSFHYLGFDGGIINGEWEDKHSTVRIKNIKTTSGKSYIISYVEYLVYHDDEEMVGIIGMSLRDEEFNVIAEIG